MAKILFVHNNFPGQFVGLVPAMRNRGHACVAVGSGTAKELPGVPLARWSTQRGSTPGIWPTAIRAEADLIRAHAAAETVLRLRAEGFEPDVIVGHPGWGETLLLREVFPQARQVLLAELYYRTYNADVGYDPEFGQPNIEENFRVHAKNSTLALAYSEANILICPTRFQASTLPEVLSSRIRIVHEGVDTDQIGPAPNVKLTLNSGCIIDRESEVITFVNRNIEPLRGAHIFLRALPAFLEARPAARAVIVGSLDGKGYGATAPAGQTWVEHFLEEIGPTLDRTRVHFVGRVTQPLLHAIMSLSRAHVYYTYPFVLSWSLLEAMACECLVIGSDTAPVREVMTHGHDGLLLDFFDVGGLSKALIAACEQPDVFKGLRRQARITVKQRFDRMRICLPAWIAAIEECC